MPARSDLLSSTAIAVVLSSEWDRETISIWETYYDLRARRWSQRQIEEHLMSSRVAWGEGERERLDGLT